MESFIYDYYGYNIEKIKDGTFDYQEYTFLLAATNENEESIKRLQQMLLSLANLFNQDIVYIVKNKYGNYISTSKDENNICLLTFKKEDHTNLSDYSKIHLTLFNTFNYQINLNDIIILWDQRLEYIQNQCLVNLNFDNIAHLQLYKCTQYSVGLAMNALQYLADLQIDFKRFTYASTLTHRRIKKMDKFELFNPFNFIIDHSSRDLAELFKNDLISFEELIATCQNYHYQIEEYEYLLARLFYPTFIFDIVEDIATDTSGFDHSSEIYEAIKKQNSQINKVKQYYLFIHQYMNIRPIDWLKN